MSKSVFGYLPRLAASGEGFPRLPDAPVGVEVIQKSRREGHLDSLADALHRCSGNVLLELLGLLIHLVADDRAGNAADDRPMIAPRAVEPVWLPITAPTALPTPAPMSAPSSFLFSDAHAESTTRGRDERNARMPAKVHSVYCDDM